MIGSLGVDLRMLVRMPDPHCEPPEKRPRRAQLLCLERLLGQSYLNRQAGRDRAFPERCLAGLPGLH